MADDFRVRLGASLGWRWTNGTVTDEGQELFQQPFSLGNAAAQAEAMWHDNEAVLAAETPRVLDLTALERPLFGDFLLSVLASVKGLWVVNHAADGTLRVGAAGQNEWSAPFGAAGQTIQVPPRGMLLLCHPGDGWAVDGAHCKLKLAASEGTLTYSIALLGTLAAD